MKMNLSILDLAQSLATHASARQNVVASNIANADTPEYQSRDLKPFADSYRQNDGNFTSRTTRSSHLHFEKSGALPATESFIEQAEQSPNGNSVSLENEMIKSVELRQQYDMALGVYRKSMDILRISLGK